MIITLSQWAEQTYRPDSRPGDKTLRAMARRGDIPGAYQTTTRRWYVSTGSVTASTVEHQVAGIVGDDPLLMAALR